MWLEYQKTGASYQYLFYSESNILMKVINVMKTTINLLAIVKNTESIINTPAVESRLKFGRTVIKEILFKGAHKGIRERWPQWEPIVTPSICSYN